MRNLLCFFILFTTIFGYAQKKKVLLIGIDGLQLEQIHKTKTPNFDTFTIKRGFNGGVFGTKSEQVTSSGPSWITILTGVWVNKHNVTSNSANQVSQSKSIFKYIKDSNSKLTTASFSTWKNINLLLYKEMYHVDFSSQGGTDKLSTQIAVNHIKNTGPDFTFIHLDDIDHAGHAYGFGKEYSRSIEVVDAQIGELLEVIKKRETDHNENWLVVLVTDHGRDAKGYGHGNHTINEKTIFVGLNKKGTSYFESINNNKKINTLKDIERYIPQTSVVPTILQFLNIPIKKEWQLDTVPLIK